MRPGPTFAYIGGKKLTEKNEYLAQIRFYVRLFAFSIVRCKSHCISTVM